MQKIKFLKYLVLILLLLTAFIWTMYFYEFFAIHTEEYLSIFFEEIPRLIGFPFLLLLSLIIILKSNLNRGVLLIALFLVLVSQNSSLNYYFALNNDRTLLASIIFSMSTAVTGSIFIKSMQNYPNELTKLNFKLRFLGKYDLTKFIGWSIDKKTWFVFPLVFFVVLCFSTYSLRFIYILVNVFILLIASLSILINYKVSNQDDRNKILWLLWGVSTYTILTILSIILDLFSMEQIPYLKLLFNTLKMATVLISLSMSLFFFNTFNTGVIINRTIIDGFIFIVIVLLYNTFEHYILHWIAHQLHISDALTSSFVSGFFVLIFSPMHHKLMHYLGKKFKKK